MAYKNVKYKEPMFPHQKYEDRLVAFIDVPEQDKLFKTDAEDGWCYLDYVNPPSDYFGFLDPEDHLKALEKMVQKGLQSDKEEVRNEYPWLQKKIDEARLLIKI